MNRTLEGWIKKSHKLPDIQGNPWIAIDFQTIGKLDIKLNNEWSNIKDKLNQEEQLLKFDEYSYLSRLWVLASYEIIRNLKENDGRAGIIETYELFRRVRIPLAKYEIADNRNGIDYSKDFGIAFASFGKGKDLGWAISPDTFISRDELADAIYKLY